MNGLLSLDGGPFKEILTELQFSYRITFSMTCQRLQEEPNIAQLEPEPEPKPEPRARSQSTSQSPEAEPVYNRFLKQTLCHGDRPI